MEIILGGYVRNADITIKVNGAEVDKVVNCDSQNPYSEWNALRN